MKPVIHASAGTVALFCLASFWTSTAVSELFFAAQAIVTVKVWILNGMWILIPAMTIAGSSGFALASTRSGRLVAAKKKRMRIVAMNGLFIMLPSAFFLAHKATAGQFDTLFYAVQGVELAVGLVQLILMGCNFKDGLKLAGRLNLASLRVGRRG